MAEPQLTLFQGGGNGPKGGGSTPPGATDISLSAEVERRYLNYSLSVITSRALPDVRDGLKPVQRRILYSMYTNLHLYPEGRFKKCATVVGDVLGKFHPHGDTAAYDAMVRMAQDFSLRYPLVDGQGNFGSLDGDFAAAYRYTEAKLRPLAIELLSELKAKTVPMRPNYDGTTFEPVVLPARFPNLLVNGATGIAVGMATNIPPHNLTEVCDALEALIDDPLLEVKDLIKHIKGPDFPTGGEIVCTRAEMRQIYETGQGTLRVRAQYELEEGKRGQMWLIITSIPYSVSKSTIVERIADVIVARKLPLLLDVRDESTDRVRIVCEIKKDADPDLIMAFLYKHTPLQMNFGMNLTCLVPTAQPEIAGPERLNLKQMLRHFLDFRFDLVTKRLAHELSELRRRMHLLEGFKSIYDALDETLRIIRKSDGKQDAAAKMMARFALDEEQVEAILELKLYKLARLEILVITEELEQKSKEAAKLEALLKSDARRWTMVKSELHEIRQKYGDKRLTKMIANDDAPEFSADAFIIHEDVMVVVTRDGWVKRMKEIKDAQGTRMREGDSAMAVLFGSTKKPVVFFTNFGSAYVTRINDIPPSTGYGEPIQKLFKFDDGERLVAAYSLDERMMTALPPAVSSSGQAKAIAEGQEPAPVDPLAKPHLLAVTKKGFGLRFSLLPHTDLSTRSGRKFAKLAEGDEVVSVHLVNDADLVIVATRDGRALICKVDEVNVLAGAGRGVTVLKTQDNDGVLGAAVGADGKVWLEVETTKGKSITVTSRNHEVTGRGGIGRELVKRDTLARVVPPAIVLPEVKS